MNKKSLLNIAFAGAMAFSMAPGVTFAHDEFAGGDGKGENLQGVELSAPLLEGSKNMSNIQEVAAVPLKELKEGINNSTGDVYGYKGYAYVGTHRANGGEGGVRVFDMKDPSDPVEVAAFGTLEGTWQEKVIVKSVDTPHFKGDLAVVSVQKMDMHSDAEGGFLLYDVTDPENPVKLGFWEDPSDARGTHELYLFVQNGKPYVLTANCYADYYSDGEVMDVQLVDVSDPSLPESIYQFDPREVIEGISDKNYDGYRWIDEDGVERAVFAHSVMTDRTGNTAYLSYWDLGTIILDISDPENPEYLGRTDFGPTVQGAAHSSTTAKGGNILIETREVFDPTREGFEAAYGYTRIYDIKDKTDPKLLSSFKTEFTEKIPGGATVHDPKVRGNTLYLSHYSGGVRAVDITDPSSPVQTAAYIPSKSNIWGVFVDRNYILASDMGQGLKVLQKSPSDNQSPTESE